MNYARKKKLSNACLNNVRNMNRFVLLKCVILLFNMFQLFALAVDLGSVPGEVTSDGQFFVRRIDFHASPFLPPNIHTYCMYRNSACVHVWFVLYAA